MAKTRIRTVDFLPEIFRTPTNKQFLAATLDQLVQDPKLKPTQGFIGRRLGPGVNPADNYVLEPTKSRADYQLEPGVIFLKPNTNTVVNALTYPGLIDSIDVKGGNSAKQDRLWKSQYYAFDPFVDYDKLINYAQYYWLPDGPESVDVFADPVPLSNDFTVTRNATNYEFSGVAGQNPTITLCRQGSYTFDVQQTGHKFWIQAVPGITGTMPQTPNQSSREVLGVLNNGDDNGTITFNVPTKDAQNFYYQLADAGQVSFATDIDFDEINNIYVSEFISKYGGLDGITDLDGRTVIFLGNAGWFYTGLYDSAGQPFDSTPYDETVEITLNSQKYSVWRITYIYDDSDNPYIKLTVDRQVDNLSKLLVQYGNQYSNISFYKNASGLFERVPLITANLDVLYYQDQDNPALFGIIRLVDQPNNTSLVVDDETTPTVTLSNATINDNILSFTTATGGVLLPGMILSGGGVTEGTYLVSATGTNTWLLNQNATGQPTTARIVDILGSRYYTSPNGVVFTNGLKVQFQGPTVPESYSGNTYYVEGVGSSIELLPVNDFITPETYTRSTTIPYDSTPYDVTPFDDSLNAPLDQDYITINRASQDQNPWTRSNRWFHVDVINVTAQYNGTVPFLDNNYRAKRPIIEFIPDLKLFNFGTMAIPAVNIIDFRATDAMSTINGSIGYSVDGYSFITGSRVIFANDRDPEVRNKVYEVTFIQPTGSGTPVIDLQPADLNAPDQLFNQSVIVTSGIQQQGTSYWFDGVTWQQAQSKTSINQPPLFDVFDGNGFSFADTEIYPSSSFAGTKLFSYAVGEGVTDTVIGQPLKYLTINNVGDIVFDNNLNIDSFVYVQQNISETKPINDGVVRQYTSRTDFTKLLGWKSGYTEVVSRQSFSFTYETNTPLVIDIPASTYTSAVPVKVFANSVFVDTDSYTYTVTDKNTTVITFINQPSAGTIIEVSIVSDVASPTGFYNIPLNLENNAINEEVTELTLGTLRNHYGTICQNLSSFTGTINGANNSRDLGDLVPYGQVIMQQSSPVTMTGAFINNPEFDVCRSLEFSSREYEKYKNLIMDTVVKSDFQNMTPAQILDDCISFINLGKNELTPFYWTDTVPCGETFKETNYTVTPITSDTFDTLYTYDFTTANYRAILVYLNGEQLLGNGLEYEVAVDGPRVTILVPLALGDVVTVREYESTFANFVPATPTKLGLYPSFVPEVFLDDTYVDPTLVIRGHDGSITVAYRDIRDEVLLEFEKRIYNNLKTKDNPVPLTLADVSPGEFRRTDYTQEEITNILGVSFLSWVGANKLPYREQEYIANNKFTWNYTQSQNKLNNTETLLGAWRGIYNWFYDTDAPNTRPWEMLGFSEKPLWWEDEYGPAPYTSGNLVLWEDLAAGRVMDPAGSYVIEKYIRPRLTEVIPSDSEGALLSPFDVMVGDYDVNSFRKSWTVGDDGPVEASWRKSSAWPFAVMRLLALTRPAEFFALFADRDLYRFNEDFDQYLYNNRFRLDPANIEIYGNGTIKNSYINFIVDYNRQTGLDSTADLKTMLENLDVRLCYRMASYSDKKYIKLFTEKSSPNSLNTSLLLPDESYQLLLYKNPTIAALTWSSVIIQKTELGYTVYGYSTVRPYFEILASIPNGNYRTLTVGGKQVRVANDYSNKVVQVPYGFEFPSVGSVVDFLMSYGAFLTSQGMSFEDQENGRLLNWSQMAQEFMYWSQQGWAPGSLININPVANKLSILKPGLVAEPLSISAPEDILLNQNKQGLQAQDYVVERFENDITLRAINNNTLSYLSAKFTQFEHMIVLDNTSIFNDLIYNPATGARQSRLLFAGYTTYEWNGSLDAQGFILNQDNVPDWIPNKSYTKGQIVKYKDAYWSAVKIIPPQSTFDFALWLKSDYAEIQKGLLPNAATASENARNFYDTKQANLEIDADLFSFGLIGFRPRRYMQNLNLDDISQVQLYQQFLGIKGTTQATDLFTKANLGKEVAEYEIFENWAIQRAVYGANANRSYFELRLNEADLLGNPSTVQIIEPGQFSEADQTVQISQIWKQSYPITNTNILPTTELNATDVQLPSAGYVNWDDADIKLFNFADLNNIINDIENIYVGTSVWVAKDNAYDWNIYRNNLVIQNVIEVRDNLNGTSNIKFAGQHGLVIDEQIVIKYFGDGVDGAYRVVAVPSLQTITVPLSLSGSATTVTGIGVCFVLETMRVKQASDVSNLVYANSLLPGNRAWVDNDGTGHWVVYEKINPFTAAPGITPAEPIASSRFGAAISQGFGGLAALFGAPGYNGDPGAVYTFTKGGTTSYVETGVLEMAAPNFENYGSALASGGSQWGIAGAANSWAKQGYAVTINRNLNSGDFVQSQLLTTVPYRLYQATGNGITTSYNPTGVTMTDLTKVGIVVDDVIKVYGTDWTYSSPNVVFAIAPDSGADINIFNYDEFGYSVAISKDERWMYIGAPSGNRIYAYNKVDVQTQSKNFVGDGLTTDFYIADVIIVDDDSTSGGAGAQQIGVTVNNLPKTVGVDYDYVNGYVVFNSPPNTADKIRVIRLQSKTFFPTVPQSIFAVDELYTITDIYSFSVYVDSVLQRPNMDYSFNGTTKQITFLDAVTGTVLINAGSYFEYIDYIDTNETVAGARFGHSIDTTDDGRQIVIGAPDDTADSKLLAGKVYMFDRCVEKFTVTDATQTEYSTLRNFNGPATVKVNATFLIPDAFNNDGQFTQVSANTVSIGVPLTVGDIIEIETNQFQFVQSIASNEPQAGAEFGRVVNQCPTNCSLYIGQPNDSRVLPEAGSVERWSNQSRLYGIITGTEQNPTLTPGDTVRIQNVDIEVTQPATWNSAVAWNRGSYVIDSGSIYYALQNVPASTSITDTSYWKESSWIESYANDINVAAAPNNIGLVLLPNVSASVANGYLTLTIANHDAATPFTQLLVLPGEGSAFTDIGFNVQVYAQTVEAPAQIAYAHFGASLTVSDNARTLVVGSPQGTAAKPTTFDSGATFFDSKATEFFDPLPESGVAYTYDLLSAANPSITNPSKFVFGQQIYDEDVNSLDTFGTAVSYENGILLVGSPQDDLGDSVGDFGRISQLNNIDRLNAWNVVYRQQPIVDVHLINSVFTYDRLESKVTQYFDFIDPLQGKILGAARQNIDFLGAVDPAAYNVGVINNYGGTWNDTHVGQIWWDLSTVRFIDYHQSTIAYASRRWSQVFPGSTIDIYQWIESPVPPAEYSGPGTPYSTTSYVVSSKLNADGLFTSVYFYWVKNLPEVATQLNKTLSPLAIAQYIENPRSSGIPWVAFLGTSTIALYNARSYISAQDTIINVEFDKIANNDNVHVEYDLIAAGNPDSFLGAGLYRKMLDSFCGEDTLGNKVPDPNLSPADLYGVQFRPRQSFFVDRFLALQNYLERANSIMAQFALSDSRPFNLLNSEEPEPTSASGEWNKRVLTYTELTYQDLSEVPVGYKYLVVSDSTQDGLWTIYTVQADMSLLLTRVQNYDTKLYWEYIDWVQTGYNAGVKPVAEVATFNDLARLTVPEGSSAKVTKNSFGKFEVYQYNNGTWTRVVLEDGTVRIKEEVWNYAVGRFGFDVETFDSQYFDQYPAVETRQILKAINEEILVDELAIFRNELLLLVFEFILTEQIAPDWLFKTSLIDVNHKIRDLLPYQIFRTDNQDFVLDYIKEVKPYHVKIKEFNLKYEGLDTYPGNVTDFDCPPYYDSALGEFEAPALDDSVPPKYSNSEPSTAAIWQEIPWQQWYDNYKLLLSGATIIDAGVGYTVPPQVVVTGDAEVEAEIVARVNTAGQVVELIVLDPGSGYTTTPIITFEGGNGTGARAVAVLDSQLVRTIGTTIKYDRVTYTSQVVDWEPNTKYTEGQLVRYNNQVWSVNEVDDSSELDSGPIFDPTEYTEVDQSTLDAADRVIGLYTPTPNEPGRELAQVMVGIDYPGVQVFGPNFNQNTGYDVGNFDVNPFDNIDYGPEGLPTYSESILDAIYESSFTDTYLGTRPTDVNVDGGAFIDTYSSHAPEELVPGSTFDTLDLRVYTRPGADWEGNGHGFNIKAINLEYSTSTPSVSFADVMAHTVAVRVVNITNRIALVPEEQYLVDWPTRTVTVINGASNGDVIQVIAYGIGGGSQLFKESYSGAVVGNQLVIPVINAVTWSTFTIYTQGTYVEFNNNVYRVNENINSGSSFNVEFYTIVDADSVLEELLVIVNGEIVTNYTYSSINGYETRITFADTYTSSDWVVVTAFGPTTPQKTWSFPVTEYFVYDGSTTTYTLENSLQGTNDIDMIVERDGQRLRPAESIRYVADGSSAAPYYLPTRGGTNQGLISDNDLVVYVNQVKQNLSVDYTLSPWDGSSDRYVEFSTAPAAGAEIKIAVTTDADYVVNGDQLILRVGAAFNAVFAVTTWNDTSEQGLYTQVFQGPTETGTVIGQPYDDTPFDQATVSFDPGSFDYGTGTVIATNEFDTGTEITDSARLWVTINGQRLIAGDDYTTSGTKVIIGGSIIGPADVLVITSFTMGVVPEAIGFRIFQDMLGNQKMYRITPDCSTVLTQPLSDSDDVIYVLDAGDLSQPNPAANIFGQLTINGERITYRNRDLINNTVSGLRRGVAGTAINSHAVDSIVIDIGFGQMLPAQYQKNTVDNILKGDGSSTTFTTDITYVNDVVVKNGGTIRVFNGVTTGTLVEVSGDEYTVTAIDPISVTLDFIPLAASIVRVQYTSPLGLITNIDLTASGSSQVFTTTISASYQTIAGTQYTVSSVDPVTVVFNSTVADRKIITINDQNDSNFFVGTGSTATYVTTIELAQPVQVIVGGTALARSQFTVSSVSPITVELAQAPADNVDVEIYIQQARVMYAQGVGTASNGRPLQEQETLAAWFIEGRV